MASRLSLGLLIIFLSIIISYVLITGKLFYWQVLVSDKLKDLRDRQSVESLDLYPKRGDILFQDKFPLATNNIKYLIYANPKLISEKKDYSKKLSNLLGYEEASIAARLNQDLFWVRLGVVDYKDKTAIENLKLEGVGSEIETSRYYPEASIAAHLVGFVGKNERGEDQGYLGLEGYYEKQLRGKKGKLYIVKDALGNPIIANVREEKKVDGRSLITTIDRTIQFIADEALKQGVKRYNAEGGSIIIMDPASGKILAMTSVPKFDSQKYYEYEGSLYQNPAISRLYEPGSTFKVLVMGAAINEGLVESDTKCTICNGPIELGGFIIKTWNDKYHPNTTMTEVIQNSDNTGMVFVAQKLGIKKMYQYIKQLGFGEQTGIDLQGESSGNIRRETEWLPIDLATASFGQGISVTPIQLLTAVSSIANGGYLVKPYVVEKIIDEDNNEIIVKNKKKNKVFSSRAIEVMTWMMVNSVENGDSKWVKLATIPVAGKTGTAQIPVAGHYDPNQTIASFVGFFPADNPKISMLVLLDRPKTSIYGSETAAPIFFSVAEDLVRYLNIQPE